MKMGIKEFRERLGEVARGSEPVQLTDRGRVVGVYTPWPRIDAAHLERARKAAAGVEAWQAELRAKGIDTEEWLADLGLDPWGAPLSDAHDR
jgi:hypothetical protein